MIGVLLAMQNHNDILEPTGTINVGHLDLSHNMLSIVDSGRCKDSTTQQKNIYTYIWNIRKTERQTLKNPEDCILRQWSSLDLESTKFRKMETTGSFVLQKVQQTGEKNL